MSGPPSAPLAAAFLRALALARLVRFGETSDGYGTISYGEFTTTPRAPSPVLKNNAFVPKIPEYSMESAADALAAVRQEGSKKMEPSTAAVGFAAQPVQVTSQAPLFADSATAEGETSSTHSTASVTVMAALLGGGATALLLCCIWRCMSNRKRRKYVQTLMQERFADSSYRTAFEWDAIGLEGVKVGSWPAFTAEASKQFPGVESDFLFSSEEFLSIRSQSAVPVMSENDMKTRIWGAE